MNILFIDTSKSSLVSVTLEINGKRFLKESEQKFGSQALLKLVHDVCVENGVLIKELNEIKVATGPGSYTGLRVGAAVANAFGYSLGILVNGKKMETDLMYA